MSKLKTIGFTVLGLFIALVILGAVIEGDDTTTDTNNAQAETVVEEKDVAIAENDAELFCQDANLLDKYVHLDKTGIIDMWNYNKLYNDWGQFDSDGNPVMHFGWNGKDKTDDSTLRFNCWVAGTKDDIRLMQLDVGGTTVHAIPMYDADGKEIE